MKFSRQILGCLLCLTVLGAPALACLTSADLSPAERECCEQMAQQCGEMDNMPASHSCCRTELQQPHAMIVAKQAVASLVLLAELPPFQSDGITAEISRELPFVSFHSPPESPQFESSVLRI